MNAVIRLMLLCAALLSDLDGASLQQTVDSIMGNRTGAAATLRSIPLARRVRRHPIPLRRETRPRQFYRQTGSPLGWFSDDDAVIENFVRRLKIDLRKRSATPTA